MTAVKIVGRAPFAIRYSAIGRLPTCDAASIGVSQSPNPQSQDARARAGRAETSSLTRARFEWDTPTISLTRSGSCAGNAPDGVAACGVAADCGENAYGTAGTTPRKP